ncbi:MAG: septum formation initiator family protein [Patescibacteria group bacterium]|jgi:cell division protein FtsB
MREKNLSNNRPFLKRLFQSKLAIFSEIAILVLLSSALAKEIIHQYQIKSDIKKLQNQIGDLEENNLEMNNLITYFNSESYKEEQARLKLDMQKPGESVIKVLGDSVNTTSSNIEDEPSSNIEIDSNNNPQRWWNYFFKGNN